MVEPPIGLLSEVWTFEDQNRCFEICGLLIGGIPSSTTDGRDSSVETYRSALLQRLLEPLLRPFENLAPSSSVRSPSTEQFSDHIEEESLQQLNCRDSNGCLDFVARLLQACANLIKGINPAEEFSELWLRMLRSELLALQVSLCGSKIG